MARRGEVVVEILGDSRGLSGALDSAGGKLAGFGKAAIAVGATVAAGAAAAGVALFKIGDSFDAASDSIRVATGKTGETLKGLEQEFKDVVRNVPTDFESASSAIGQLHQRLGLTGDDLGALSEQFLELSRLTGTDLSTNISEVTRAFGDWGVQTADQGKALDKLFRASQATGVSVDALSSALVQFGAPLRQLGFSFEESTALIGKFEKEGVNTELVLGAMRIALGRMARAGEPAVETFKRVTEEIKSAGSASEANALALQLFGARAGPDMAAAIREGRFELGNLLSAITTGTDTIKAAGADTEDFSEKWLKFKNQVMVGLEPLATGVFNALGNGLERVIPLAQQFAAWFNERIGPAVNAVAAFISERMVPALQNLAQWFGEKVLPHLQAAAATIFERVQPALKTMEDAFRRNEPEIRKVLEKVQELAAWAAQHLLPILAAVAAFMIDTFARNFAITLDVIGKMVKAIEALVKAYSQFRDIVSKIPGGAGVVGSLLPKFHSGGVVPGPPGMEVPIMAQAGEMVLPRGAGGGSMLVTINMPAGSDGDDVVAALQRYRRRNGSLPF